MLYNTEFLCTYPFYDDELIDMNPLWRDFKKGEMELDVDKDNADILYKNELLSAFNLEEFDETLLNTSISNLYKEKVEKVEGETEEGIKSICKKVAEKLLTEDESIGFILLFSYEFFHITHFCMCEFLLTGNIKKENLELLMEVVSK